MREVGKAARDVKGRIRNTDEKFKYPAILLLFALLGRLVWGFHTGELGSPTPPAAPQLMIEAPKSISITTLEVGGDLQKKLATLSTCFAAADRQERAIEGAFKKSSDPMGYVRNPKWVRTNAYMLRLVTYSHKLMRMTLESNGPNLEGQASVEVAKRGALALKSSR